MESSALAFFRLLGCRTPDAPFYTSVTRSGITHQLDFEANIMDAEERPRKFPTRSPLPWFSEFSDEKGY